MLPARSPFLNGKETPHAIERLSLGWRFSRHLGVEDPPHLGIAHQSLPEIENVRARAALDELVAERDHRRIDLIERHMKHHNPDDCARRSVACRDERQYAVGEFTGTRRWPRGAGRSHDGDWEAALESVEQLTVAVSRVGDWRARSREEINDGGNAEADA